MIYLYGPPYDASGGIVTHLAISDTFDARTLCGALTRLLYHTGDPQRVCPKCLAAAKAIHHWYGHAPAGIGTKVAEPAGRGAWLVDPRPPAHEATITPEGDHYLVTCPHGCALGTSRQVRDMTAAAKRVEMHRTATTPLGKL